jgi:hypothetical protein
MLQNVIPEIAAIGKFHKNVEAGNKRSKVCNLIAFKPCMFVVDDVGMFAESFESFDFFENAL